MAEVPTSEETTQTASVVWLNQSFAEHPARSLTPQRLYQILLDAEQGNLTAQADLFCDMEERDAHIYAEMSKRKRAILSLPWSIEPPRNADAAEKKLAEELADWVREIPDWEDVQLDALDAIGHGFAALEITWGREEAVWLPTALTHQPQRNFMTPIGQPDTITLRDGSINGAPLWEYGWWVHRHRAKSGYLARSGLHRILSWPYLFKNYALRDLAEFLEIYGLPLRLGKYPAGATQAERDILMRAVQMIGHNAAGIIPQGMAIDFQNAAQGHADPFEAMIKWAELAISKAIIGGTLTTQADGKSSTNAQGRVHENQQQLILHSDARQLAGSINQNLVGALMALNHPEVDPRRYPQLVYDLSEPEDIGLYADALPKLVGVGVQIPEGWARQRLGIPEPQDGEAVLGVVPALPSPAATRAANGQQLRRAALAVEILDEVYDDQVQLDDAVNRISAGDYQGDIEGILEPVLAALSQCSNEAEALGVLAELQPGQSVERLQQRLEGLLLAANAWGRISAKRELS